MVKGWVYVITNKAIPGLVKVGFSLKDPALRAIELETAGIPYPFHVEYKILICGPRDIEQKIHRAMRDYHAAKEWFSCSVNKAIDVVNQIGGSLIHYHEASLSTPDLSPAEREALMAEMHIREQREREQRELDLAEADRVRTKFALRRQMDRKH
jgi:hypothetical protein